MKSYPFVDIIKKSIPYGVEMMDQKYFDVESASIVIIFDFSSRLWPSNESKKIEANCMSVSESQLLKSTRDFLTVIIF